MLIFLVKKYIFGLTKLYFWSKMVLVCYILVSYNFGWLYY